MKYNTKIFLTLVPLTLYLLFVGCKKDKPVQPPPPIPQAKDTITITVEQTTHRSISIGINKKMQIKTDKYHLYRIFEDSVETEGIYSISGFDTKIIDDNNGLGLLLDTTYSYFVVRFDSLDEAKDSSNTVTAKTLAATSHNYTWQEITIGEWQSALYDVWGTDENNVYATGGIRLNGISHGLVHYDGNNWTATNGVGGSAIFGFSENDIWIAGAQVFQYNGNEWNRIDGYTSNGQSFPLDPVLFDNTPYTSIWGTDSNNLYFTGIEGRIVHWDGSKATLMSTPTNINITDIYGISADFILCTGSAFVYPSTVMKYNGQNWQMLTGLIYDDILLFTTYVLNKKMFFVGGSRIFMNYGIGWEEILRNSPGSIQKIRANPVTQEMMAVGWDKAIFHYNGEDWVDLSTILPGSFSILRSVYLVNNKVFIVGDNGSYAKIFIGTKIN